MIALALSVSLLVVLGNLALVARFVLRWERRGGWQPGGTHPPAAAQQPTDARRGALGT
jgi:hypothetical protein